MKPSSSTGPSRIAAACLTSFAFAASACSAYGTPDVVARPTQAASSRNVDAPTSKAPEVDPAVQAADTVDITGVVVAIADGPVATAGATLAGADVCVLAGDASTCTSTGEDGQYSLTVAKSNTVAELRVERDGFAPTVTHVPLDVDTQPTVGMVPSPSSGDDQEGFVIVRSFVSVYFQTLPIGGVDVQVQAGGQSRSATTDGDGWAVLGAAPAGALQGGGKDGWIECPLIDGFADADILPQTTTELDVLCDVDHAQPKP